MDEINKVKYKDCYTEASAIVHRKIGTSKRFSEADKRDVTALLTNHLLESREHWHEQTNNIYTELQRQQYLLISKTEAFRAIKGDAVRFARGHVTQLDSHAHDMTTTTELLQKLSAFLSDNNLGTGASAAAAIENAFFIETLDKLLERMGKVIQHTEALTYERQKCLLLLQRSASLGRAPHVNLKPVSSPRSASLGRAPHVNLKPVSSPRFLTNGYHGGASTVSKPPPPTKTEFGFKLSDVFHQNDVKANDDVTSRRPDNTNFDSSAAGEYFIGIDQRHKNVNCKVNGLQQNQAKVSQSGRRHDAVTLIGVKTSKSGDVTFNGVTCERNTKAMTDRNIVSPGYEKIARNADLTPLRPNTNNGHTDRGLSGGRHTKLCRHDVADSRQNVKAKSNGHSKALVNNTGNERNGSIINLHHERCKTAINGKGKALRHREPLTKNDTISHDENLFNGCLSNRKIVGKSSDSNIANTITPEKHSAIRVVDITYKYVRDLDEKAFNPDSFTAQSPGIVSNSCDKVKENAGDFDEDDEDADYDYDDEDDSASDNDTRSKSTQSFKWDDNHKPITDLHRQTTNLSLNGATIDQPSNVWSKVVRQLGQTYPTATTKQKASSYLEQLLVGDTNFSSSSEIIQDSVDKDHRIERLSEDRRELEEEVSELEEIFGEMSERIEEINRELSKQNYNIAEEDLID